MKIPEFWHNQLFQYRPPTAWAFENLCRGVMFYRSPLDFNDPYDCRTPPIVPHLTDKRFNFLREKHLGVLGTPSAEDCATPEGLALYINNQLMRRHKEKIKKIGVACFSKSNNNLLMWSHYAAGGKGFCLEFDNDGHNMNAFDFKVEYRKNPPSAYEYFKRLARNKDALPSTKLFQQVLLTYKHKEWEYEQEVRIIREKVGEKEYPPESLKAVYLGTQATKGTEKLVRTIVKAKYGDIKVIKGELSKDKCQVVFDGDN